MSNSKIARIGTFFGALVLVLSPRGALHAQFTITEINPNQSSFDAADADSASGGRINGLATVAGNANTVSAASEKGGLWRSTDAGRTWLLLSGHRPMFTIDIEVDPGNTNRVIATSTFDGRVTSLAGINVSNDGGTTWNNPIAAWATPLAAPATCLLANRQEPAAFGIAFDPATPQNVFVGTNCGVAISNDSGATWRFVDPEGFGHANTVWDVVVHDGGIIDVCSNDGHWRSTDGGTVWATATGTPLPAGRCQIVVSPDEANVLLATVRADVFESDDGGANWTRLGTPDSRRQGRIPLVATNQRSNGQCPGGNDCFELWSGAVGLFRASCRTNPPGGGLRCPTATLANPLPTPPPATPAGWNGPFTRAVGGHDDVGAIVFNPTAANDACPTIFSSDGGAYFNTGINSPGCHTPGWEQPNVTPHATWLWSMAGADRAGLPNEDLYFGLQDNGPFGTTTAGAAAPAWTASDCCDVFDVSAEPARALYTFCCGGPRATTLVRRGAGLAGGGGLADPGSYRADGLLPSFRFPDVLDRWGANSYVVLTNDCRPPNGIDDDGNGTVDDANELQGCTGTNGGDGGVHITTNAGANPVVWTELGNATEPASNAACAVEAAVTGGTPTFYVQVGSCDGNGGDTLLRFAGTAAAGAWAAVNLPAGGLGVFVVDPTNPQRLFISNRVGNTVRMMASNDGGTIWTNDLELDQRMVGSGSFRAFSNTRNDVQPTFVAFDPDDNNLLAAGGIDSGLFVSVDGGQDWLVASDPLNSHVSGTPHLPRPRYAYFDHEPANVVNLYVGTEGRGVWRVSFFRPPVAEAGGPYTTNEGTPVVLSGSGTDKDPGALTLEWDLDNDGAFDDAAGATPTFTGVVQNGVFTVRLRVTDADGASDVDDAQVTVLNVPPTVNAGPDQLVFEDDPATVNATFTDPGILDTHTAVVDWGDGTPPTPGAVTQGAGSGSVTASHVYPDPGIFVVTVTVTDSDGGVGSDPMTMTVVFGFLKYCVFGEGARDSWFLPDGVKARRGSETDCGLGAMKRLRLARNTEIMGDLRSVESRLRTSGVVAGDLRAGFRIKLRRPAEVTGDAVTLAEDIRVRRGATLDGAATAGAQVTGGGTITGTATGGAPQPPDPPMTTITLALTAGGADQFIDRGQTLTLAPGSYGELLMRRGATLELSAGRYHFQRVRLGRSVTVRLDLTGGPVIVDSLGSFRLGGDGKVEITSATGDAASFLIQVATPRRVRLGRGGDLLGTVLAPQARVRIGSGAKLEGALYGRKVGVSRRVEIVGKPAILVIVSLYL